MQANSKILQLCCHHVQLRVFYPRPTNVCLCREKLLTYNESAKNNKYHEIRLDCCHETIQSRHARSLRPTRVACRCPGQQIVLQNLDSKLDGSEELHWQIKIAMVRVRVMHWEMGIFTGLSDGYFVVSVDTSLSMQTILKNLNAAAYSG
jgi:hypothetical protein